MSKWKASKIKKKSVVHDIIPGLIAAGVATKMLPIIESYEEKKRQRWYSEKFGIDLLSAGALLVFFFLGFVAGNLFSILWFMGSL